MALATALTQTCILMCNLRGCGQPGICETMKAILSDIHANLEALRAVLEEIDRLNVSVIYNLGDTTIYGPNPIECIDLAMRMDVVLLGCFDLAVLIDPFAFPPAAEKSVYWTRELLESADSVMGAGPSRRQFLASLKPSHQDADALYVHGSPARPLHEYVFGEDVHNPKKMARNSEHFQQLCFHGHTHIPGLIVENGPEDWQFLKPSDCVSMFTLDGRRVMCNVGSVGQPRDGDWRAGFVLFDGATIRFHRVEYDIDRTVRKIFGDPGLDDFFGGRLRDGW
ncbi:MAG: metallophosphoesterase family protein [Planctomycetales bacterium]